MDDSGPIGRPLGTGPRSRSWFMHVAQYGPWPPAHQQLLDKIDGFDILAPGKTRVSMHTWRARVMGKRRADLRDQFLMGNDARTLAAHWGSSTRNLEFYGAGKNWIGTNQGMQIWVEIAPQHAHTVMMRLKQSFICMWNVKSQGNSGIQPENGILAVLGFLLLLSYQVLSCSDLRRRNHKTCLTFL